MSMITISAQASQITTIAPSMVYPDFLTLRNAIRQTALRVSDKVVITKKPRQCYACLRKFDLGYSMRKQIFQYLNEVHPIYSCGTCEVLMEKFPTVFCDPSSDFFPTSCVDQVVRNYNSIERIQDLTVTGEIVPVTESPEELLKKLQIPGATHYMRSNFNGSFHTPGHMPSTGNPITVINGYAPLNLTASAQQITFSYPIV